MRKSYLVALNPEERASLEKLISTGRTSAKRQTHGRILLKADAGLAGPGWTDEQICTALDVSPATVARVRKRFVEQGLEAVIHRRKMPRPSRRRLDRAQEARLLALACSPAPEGQARWTLRLLADQMVILEYVESISYETVRSVLKKNEIKPHLKECWCIPAEHNAEFVCRMEDVLEVYGRPHDRSHPVVCMDESTKQLLEEVRQPIAGKPGSVERYDCEYRRNGVATLFVAFEPLAGWRHVEVTEQRTRQDFARFIQDLLDHRYPEAERVVLIMDNLNTHSGASLYETFAPAEARRLWSRLEVHYTPKHGSWLNMAEGEFSILQRQCLDRRIANPELLQQEIAAWESQRNEARIGANWKFTTADARIKLRRLYPSFLE
ncbi:MAG TPA: IS630 family transposase [Thermoanaerobaculia bacterium]|nr:IS630 family transposase [Thermoanaerobaculia bacterium]